jgi:cytidyltransferase-like protein
MENGQTTKKVLVFGTFDNLDGEHMFFLSEASKLGELYVSVSSDESASQRKGKHPVQNATQRVEGVRKLGIAVDVSEGDKTLNSWTDIKKVRPDIIALGFDQYGLKTALADIQAEYGFDIKIIAHFDPENMQTL